MAVDGINRWTPSRKAGEILRVSTVNINQSDSARVWRMSGLTRGGTAERVSKDKIFRRERGQGKHDYIVFPVKLIIRAGLATMPGYPYSAECTDDMYIHTFSM